MLNMSTSCDLLIKSLDAPISPQLTDPILLKYKDDIKDFAYSTKNIKNALVDLGAENSRVRFSDLASIISRD